MYKKLNVATIVVVASLFFCDGKATELESDLITPELIMYCFEVTHPAVASSPTQLSFEFVDEVDFDIDTSIPSYFEVGIAVLGIGLLTWKYIIPRIWPKKNPA